MNKQEYLTVNKRPKCPRCGRQMMRHGYTPGGRQRWLCARRDGARGTDLCYSTTDPAPEGVRDQGGRVTRRKAPIFKRSVGKETRRFIVTTAQNATPVHKGFFASLERMAKTNGAELLVIPIRYKNPTSRWTNSQANEEVWAPEVTPYLCNTRIRLNRNLVVLGDVKTQPTASSPLTGFEGITHGESGILGHTKLQLRTIATPQHRLPKILTTTGAVTIPNYTDSKAGKLGEFHHTLGAALIELDGPRFHLRQLNAEKDGSFHDLDKRYTPDKVETGLRLAGLAMGDTHVDFIDKRVEAATFGGGGIVEQLRPRTLIWNDLLDGYSVNPHHAGNPFILFAKTQAGKVDVRAEIERAAEFVRQRTSAESTSVIVPSNHNDFVARWVLATDWRQAPVNAKFYLETALAMLSSARITAQGAEYSDPAGYWLKRLLVDLDNVVVLERGESHLVAGIENGLHGDVGPSGTRGSLRNLRRIGVRVNIGHSHAPGIDEGGYQAGTSTALTLEYSRGSPSAWLNTHIATYPNGKRSLINIIDGRWKA